MRSVDLDEEQRIESTRENHWPLAPPSESDLPAGEYIAAYLSCVQGEWFKQAKIKLLFEIVEPRQFAGIVVPLWATIQKKISPAWKYYAIWTKAKGCSPRRKDRMHPRYSTDGGMSKSDGANRGKERMQCLR